MYIRPPGSNLNLESIYREHPCSLTPSLSPSPRSPFGLHDIALANPRIFYLQLFQSASMILSSFFVFRYLNTLHSQYANMQASPPQRNKQTPTIRHSLIIKAWTRHQPRPKTDTIPIPPTKKGNPPLVTPPYYHSLPQSILCQLQACQFFYLLNWQICIFRNFLIR